MSPTRPKKNELIARPTFGEVALLIAPSNAPSWLPGFLEWWAEGIRYDRMVDEIRPSRARTAEILSETEDALILVRRNLDVPSIRNLVDETKHRSPTINTLMAAIKDLTDRIASTRLSPLVIGTDGKTKRGRGKPTAPNVFNAKTLCAARILELGRFLNKFEPGTKSTNAAKAAEAYWLASGGDSEGFGDPINGWKHHFKLAKDHAGSIGLKRLIWWRDLQQCQRRGRAPWFLGTQIPPQ
jgi:hypothetical protein